MTKYLVSFLSTSIYQMDTDFDAWFGVSANDVKTVLFNIRTFELYKLGIFKG